jgi:DNA-binding NtrC family response regulator
VAYTGESWLADELAGSGRAMAALRRSIAQLAPLDTTVLVTGETGVGKGLVARALHRLSPRRTARFVHADCASLAPSLIESELFGHERGAFTGATARRAGRFEQAAGGTIFLDEIGELPAVLQARLLRVLQDREYERIGANMSLPMTARVVAATHRDLAQELAAGRFRADLYFRLCVVHIEVPPLRERPEDVPALIARGLARLARRLALPPPRLAPDQIARLARCRWPGNVRELFNALERIAIHCPGRAVEETDLAAALDRLERGAAPPPQYAWLAAAVRAGPDRVAAALCAARGNVAAAARALGIPRSTLRRRIERFGLAALRRSALAERREPSAQHEAECDQREHPPVERHEERFTHAPQDPAADPGADQHGRDEQSQGAAIGRELEARGAKGHELGCVAEGLAGSLRADHRLAREADVQKERSDQRADGADGDAQRTRDAAEYDEAAPHVGAFRVRTEQ